MDPGLHAAMSLGGFQRPLLPGEKIAQKIRLILETKPGSIPWRPKFGCDLSSLVGQPATNQRLHEARWRVEQALERWMPDVEVLECRLRVIPRGNSLSALKDPSVPLAESSILSLGIEANLEIHLELALPAGAFLVTTEVNP